MSDHNPFPGENNTGHIWDDNLRELNNPCPTWWMNAFYASWAFVIGYVIIYPAIPFFVGSFSKGAMGWSAMNEFKADMAVVEQIRKPYEDKIASMSAAEILQDNQLVEYISRSGKVLFGDKCSACHGSGGAGNEGFPVLADDDWLYGGSIENIEQTITGGRQGNMPARGLMGNLSDADVDTLANYVVGLSNGQKDDAGAKLFAANCSACHGADAKGMAALGSANLTDGIWRFNEADKLASAKHTIMHGVNQNNSNTRNAVMPVFGEKITDSEIKKLAVYVYKFGGGQ